jgi:hypothetical protein
MVVRAEGVETVGQYLGTCFPFRHAHIFLTARHCIEDMGASDLAVATQYGHKLTVQRIEHHPTVDVSAVVTDPNTLGILHPFAGLYLFPGTHAIGEEFAAFGFPVGGTVHEPANIPVPRVFRGHIQRLADFRTGGLKSYTAFELSIPAPSGLSGGPVFVPSEADRVFGVVTGNADSYMTEVEEVEEMTPGCTSRTTVKRIISYGMALSLMGVRDWLDEVAPLVGQARW